MEARRREEAHQEHARVAARLQTRSHSSRRSPRRERNRQDVRALLETLVGMDTDAPARSVLNGFDVDGRPIIYMAPAKENTEGSPRQLRHLVFVLQVDPL
jgi:hypothetical protein